MTGQLRGVGEGGDGDAPARCAICSGLAVGPCARCHRPVCGDCCELTEGGVRTWAVCLGCARRGGTSLGAGWRAVLFWVLAPALLLAAAAAALVWMRR
jgi:hypothetical protein